MASGRRQSGEDFCARMAAQGSWKLTPVDNAKDAVADMDIVVSSTPHLAEPPVKGKWWNPGTLVIPLDVLSGWDDEALGMTDRLVTDGYPVLSRFADPRRPDFRLPENWSSLADVVAGKEAGWREDQGRVMAIPTGVASTDMTLGWEIHRRAEASGIGTRIKFN